MWKLRKKVLLLVTGICFIMYYMIGSEPSEINTDSYPVYPFIRYVGGMKSPHESNKKRIPRIIHQTWKTNKVPILFEKWVKSWLEKNPEWEYWFWTDEDIKRLADTRFPHLKSLFERYPSQGHRVDAFRYMLLYDHGGLYADIDIECLKDLDTVIGHQECILSQEPEEHGHFLSPVGIPLVSNALMACRPRHPFFKTVLDRLPSYAGRFGWTEILHSTGPYMLTKVFRDTQTPGWFPWSSTFAPVFLALSVTFQPIVDNSMLAHMRKKCIHSTFVMLTSNKFQENQLHLCPRVMSGKSLFEHPPPEAFTVHHFTHTWAGPRHDPWGVYNSKIDFDVQDIVQREHDRKLANGR